MAIRSDEITSIIRSAIEHFDQAVDVRSVGTVVEVGDGIAQIYGLEDALSSELLEFPGGVMGMALNLSEDTVGAVILGDYTELKEGDTVKTTGRVVEVPVGVGADRARGRPARAAARRQGPHRRHAARGRWSGSPPASSPASRSTRRSRRGSRPSTR